MIQVEEVGDMVIVREELVIEGAGPLRQAYELAICTLFRMCQDLVDRYWAPLMVQFTHNAPCDLSSHRRLFGRRVLFGGDFNGIVCATGDLDRPTRTSEAGLARYARNFLEMLPYRAHTSAARDVREALYILLPKGSASITHVGEGLGVNVRRLQRRLADEGTEFTNLLVEVRRDLALRYLSDPAYSLTQVAELLGYSQLSSFTRWFSAQFGMRPSRWRSDEARRRAAETRGTTHGPTMRPL